MTVEEFEDRLRPLVAPFVTDTNNDEVDELVKAYARLEAVVDGLSQQTGLTVKRIVDHYNGPCRHGFPRPDPTPEQRGADR